MRRGTPVTLFPFLSVLISTMGVLSFLAVTFLLFARQEHTPAASETPIEISWVGAPAHVRPLLVECRPEGLLLHLGGGSRPIFFSPEALDKEVAIIKEMELKAIGRLGPTRERYRFWLHMKSAIRDEPRLLDSFTMALNRVELKNLSGEGRRRFVQRYPILLIHADGLSIYDKASYLVETTTRMNVGLEPMLKGWRLPYREEAQ